jgi:hypothetical protein
MPRSSSLLGPIAEHQKLIFAQSKLRVRVPLVIRELDFIDPWRRSLDHSADLTAEQTLVQPIGD